MMAFTMDSRMLASEARIPSGKVASGDFSTLRKSACLVTRSMAREHEYFSRTDVSPCCFTNSVLALTWKRLLRPGYIGKITKKERC